MHGLTLDSGRAKALPGRSDPRLSGPTVEKARSARGRDTDGLPPRVSHSGAVCGASVRPIGGVGVDRGRAGLGWGSGGTGPRVEIWLSRTARLPPFFSFSISHFQFQTLNSNSNSYFEIPFFQVS